MSAADVDSFFATLEAATVAARNPPIMMRHYAQLCANLRLVGRTQFTNAAARPSHVARNLCAAVHRRDSSSSSAASAPPPLPPTSDAPTHLPRYPVPDLEAALQKYLRSVEPLLSPEELQQTKRAVCGFTGPKGGGYELYKLLTDRAATTENWLADWWLKYGYLGYRVPVVCNSNPGLYFDVRPFECKEQWLSHAARTVWATMRFKERVDKNEIAQEKMGKAPLDMAQYGKFLGTCRIPKKEFDGLEYYPRSEYVVVAFRDGFHKLPVYNTAGELLTEPELLHLLLAIVDHPDESVNPPVGALTAQHRDKLAIAYEHLCRTNRPAVQTIEQSLFILCLDQAVALPAGDAQSQLNIGAHQLIHGGGVAQNSANRWFDKTLQLVVNENGLIGLNYEHSPGEGQPIAVLSDFIIDHTTANTELLKPKQPEGDRSAVKLTFGVDATLQRHLDEAAKNVDGLAGNLVMQVLDFNAYGKKFIQSQKMSPDSYLQMAMQYAFYKKHGIPGAHYETAQQRMFIHGRTETIRSCSLESVAFARAMLSPECTDAERSSALHLAVQGHKDYTVQAMTGNGCDRMLMGLRLIAREYKRPLPALFDDVSYTRSTHFRISTSQVASKHKAFMCYGPAVEDGYGICYNPRADDVLLAVSAFRSSADTNAEEMAAELKQALCDMQEMLLRASKEPTKSKL